MKPAVQLDDELDVWGPDIDPPVRGTVEYVFSDGTFVVAPLLDGKHFVAGYENDHWRLTS